MRIEHACCDTTAVIDEAEKRGLSTHLLYETVIELSGEGLLTARCINSAALVLLTQLGLPEYFFRYLSRDALKEVLRTIATNIVVHTDGHVVLRGEVSEAHFDIDGGVQIRIATSENRDRMERVLDTVMNGNRVEYYFSPAHSCYTYIIHPEVPAPQEQIPEGACPFAFTQDSTVPRSTCRRYEAFLQRSRRSVVPLVDVSRADATGELRVMFRDDFCHSVLPVVRQMLSEFGILLTRAYWETYRGQSGRLESICSLYFRAPVPEPALKSAVTNLHALLAIRSGDLDDAYVDGSLSFSEYIFAIAAHAFVHSFIHKGTATDIDILGGLSRKDLRDAFTRRIFDSNRAEYTRRLILNTIRESPELVKWLYRLFDDRFNPARETRLSAEEMEQEIEAYCRRAAVVFADDRTSLDIATFMTRIVTHVLKTNFYKKEKRAHAFRLNPELLDPIVFTGPVHGAFFIVGFYAMATHMRAAEVARGGVRLIRVTPGSYENELDAMPLLNYALGPMAQRLKHKDIAESGSKGVIVPRSEFARDGLPAVLDFADGIMDLIFPGPDVVDYLGTPEMIFFGPDEGTAGFMDAVAARAHERGYKYWRTMTTGKSTGIPHDAYGLTTDGQVFGLISRGDAGTEVQMDGQTVVVTPDLDRLYHEIGERIDTSGMTTVGVMATLRTVLEYAGLREQDVNLMMTGGPDGDLGANQIQSFRGRICLIVDGSSVLFDPDGLDRAELVKLAMARHTSPRLDSAAYPEKCLGPRGFRIPRRPGAFRLPDGTEVPDGAFFHRFFLANPEVRRFIAQANIQAFVPCGGLKDTINAENVRAFLDLFRELRVIVEGANVFFDETAREIIARGSSILQVKDTTANKGGVTCSAIAEVLSTFLLGDRYDKVLGDDTPIRISLIRAMLDLISQNAAAETRVLLAIHDATGAPLHSLSSRTSEEILSLQERLHPRLEEILASEELYHGVIRAYVPAVLLEHLGLKRVLSVLGRPELRPYRDAIVTKKIAAMALYQHAAGWDQFVGRLEKDLPGTVRELLKY